MQSSAKFAEKRRVLSVEVEQLFDLVAQKQQPQALCLEGAPEPTQRLETIVGTNIRYRDPDPVKLILRVQEGFCKIEMELLRPIGPLEVPEHGDEPEVWR